MELEQRVASGLITACGLVARAGMEQERRSLRLAVRELSGRREEDAVILEFRLSRGGYATAVLREVFAMDADYEESST